jgi:cellulose synthase/poly-beta-1,6-N-acetylglucosamine synthase-like glycosyltransferase
MSKDQNRRMKQLRKLEMLSIDKSGYATKMLTYFLYTLAYFAVLFFMCVFLLNDNSPINSFIHFFYLFILPIGTNFIYFCDFGYFNFCRAKKILNNYEPINMKEYDYLINNFTEKNNEFFWEQLDKFITSEKL